MQLEVWKRLHKEEGLLLRKFRARAFGIRDAGSGPPFRSRRSVIEWSELRGTGRVGHR